MEDPEKGIELRPVSVYKPPVRISSTYMTRYTGDSIYQVKKGGGVVKQSYALSPDGNRRKF